ncbi:MAG: YggS family pyridoxal phosphate-dependent enzyme [Candidatus Diapherotrites archaeon CG08_land_8_20_14_0_20_34_12]|nr:MAG: YggS family pyridoxal phosphate-dependent enzyme [Candidatus Diapherotrites archaeon CG08_land_8_20_14_0_20_34_12]
MQNENFQEILEKNIATIKANISDSCQKAGRAKDSVKILAAAKSQSTEKIKIAANLGISLFGENYSKEFLEKYSVLGNKINGRRIEWHFIGHLQRNKVKQIIPYIDVIESLDSIALAEKINDESAKLEKVSSVFIEVNISNESSKYGIDLKQLSDFCGKISPLDHIRVLGLMSMPALQSSEMNRKCFKLMNEQFNRLKPMNLKNFCLKDLSIGTSNDYQIAIEEGSTIIRLGSSLLGERRCTR